MLLLSRSLPAFAYVNVAFDPQGNPNANPDGSFPAGATIYFVVEVDIFDNCNRVQVDWDDPSSPPDSVTTVNQIVHLSHSYGGPGTYSVTASELCGAGGLTGNTLTVTVGGIAGPDFSSAASAPAAIGIVMGAITLGLALGNPTRKLRPK